MSDENEVTVDGAGEGGDETVVDGLTGVELEEITIVSKSAVERLSKAEVVDMVMSLQNVVQGYQTVLSQDLEPVVGQEGVDLGPGPLTSVPVVMRRLWGRRVDGVTAESIQAGPVYIGLVSLRKGVDLNTLVDAVRDGFASEG